MHLEVEMLRTFGLHDLFSPFFEMVFFSLLTNGQYRRTVFARSEWQTLEQQLDTGIRRKQEAILPLRYFIFVAMLPFYFFKLLHLLLHTTFFFIFF